MARSDDPLAGTCGRTQAVLDRDAALGRLGRARRWAIAGAAALTAGCAALASALVPGRSLARAEVAAAAASTGSKPASLAGRPLLPPAASAAQLGFQAPGQPPQAAAPPQQAPPAASSQPATPAPVQPSTSSSTGGTTVVSGGS